MKRKTAKSAFEYGLKPQECAALRDALAASPRVERAVLFGSRATGTFSPASDIDLALYGDGVTLADQADLASRMEDLNLPVTVDLLRVSTVDSDVLRKHIEQHGKLFYQKAATNRASEEKSLAMASEWKKYKLTDLAELSGGFAFKSGDYAPFGRFILRTLNIRDDGNISKDDAVFLPEELCAQYERFELREHDTLFVMVGATLGKVGFVRADDLPALLNQNMWLIRAKQEIADARFVHYAFRNSIIKSLHWASGSAREFLRRDDCRNISIAAPQKIEEQRAIAHILGTLDDKIELNRKMNETLEAMTRALFQSWFVDFAPVRAKAEGRDPGLPADIAALFPDSFENSELGPIPKGWRLLPLPEVIDVNPSRPLRKGAIAPYLDMANMPTQGHSADEVVEREFSSGMRFINGDTLVARITPCLENGKTAFVDFLDENQVGWGSTEYIVLRPKPPLPNEFAYCLARSAVFRDFAIQSMTGSSGRQRVPAEALSHFKIVSPSEPVAELFGSFVEPLFVRAGQVAKESRALAALRDTLLPKLISGELRVKTSQSEKSAPAEVCNG